DAVVISPNMRQTSRNPKLGPQSKRASTPSQITLYCRLLRIGDISPFAASLTERPFAVPRPEGVWSGHVRRRRAGLVCLTPQEGRDVEQVFLLAQARPVVWIERGQPRLRALLCRWGSRTRRRFRNSDAGTAHSGHSLDEAGYPSLWSRRGLLDRRSGRNRRLRQRNWAAGSGIDRLRNSERTDAHSRALGYLGRLRQWFAVVLHAGRRAMRGLSRTIDRRLRCILSEQGLGVHPCGRLAQRCGDCRVTIADQADGRPDLRDRVGVNTRGNDRYAHFTR